MDIVESVFKNEWFTGIGTLASILGIILTLWKVWRTSNTSKAIHKEVGSVKQEIKKIIDITELTKMNGEVELAREKIRTHSYQAACVHITRIKQFLWEYKSSVSMNCIDNLQVKECIKSLGSDITVLTNTSNEANKLDVPKLLDHINRVSDLISNWSGKIKMTNYETEKH